MTAILAYNGVTVNLDSQQELPPVLNITHNDFFSKQIYAEVVKRVGFKQEVDAITLLYIVSQVNVAQLLLPNILQKGSTLLFRLRFLMAYHSCASLEAMQNECGPALKHLLDDIRALGDLPNEKKIRNTTAHYGFGEGRKFITRDTDVLVQIIEGFSGKSMSDVNQLIDKRLALISDWTFLNFSKQSFVGRSARTPAA